MSISWGNLLGVFAETVLNELGTAAHALDGFERSRCNKSWILTTSPVFAEASGSVPNRSERVRPVPGPELVLTEPRTRITFKPFPVRFFEVSVGENKYKAFSAVTYFSLYLEKLMCYEGKVSGL